MAQVKTKPEIKRQKVVFSLEAAHAKEVFLVGDFNRWNLNKHPMKRDKNGIWGKALMIPPGTYEYKFLVDGHWQKDPRNNQVCRNCFGTYNNVLNVIAK